MATTKRYAPVPNLTNDLDPKDFDPNEQTWRLFKGQAAGLSRTVIFLGLLLAILKIYAKAGNVGGDAKSAFNTIITVMSLLLGLNFFEAFKDMAKVLRWRVLANRYFTVREADLILAGESLMKLGTLMRESRKKPLTVFVCAFWIALNLLAQASVAMMSLNYSMDGGTDSSGIITSTGTVNAPKLDCYYDGSMCTRHLPAAPEISQSLAHAYGEIVRGQQSCPYSTTDDITAASTPQKCSYFSRNDGQEFAFRYKEYNLEDSVGGYPYPTNRIVRAWPGQCFRYHVNEKSTYLRDANDGIKEEFVFPFYNETYSDILPIPKPNTAFDATTYIWNGTHVPQNATAQTCGPRCVWLYAFQSYGTITKRPNTIFKCPITISDVSNVTQATQNIPNDTARLAAASIALSGRYTNPNGSVDKVWSQYQLYTFGSYWETNDLTPQQIGSRMAEFAIGSLSSMAAFNPLSPILGTVPKLGYHLHVVWNYVIALAACICGAHFALVGLMLWISRPIVVAGDSNLAVARLLETLVGRLGGRGSLLDGKEIAEAVKGQGLGDDRVVYGIKEFSRGAEGEEGWRALELSGDVEVRNNLINGRFLAGRYW